MLWSFDFLTQQAPLIHNLGDQVGSKHLPPIVMYKELADNLNPSMFQKLSKDTAHWLGHPNLSTTSLHFDTDTKKRQMPSAKRLRECNLE